MYVCGRMFALFVRTPYRKTAEDISTELLVVAYYTWRPLRLRLCVHFEHLYSPRMVAEIKEGKILTTNEQAVM